MRITIALLSLIFMVHCGSMLGRQNMLIDSKGNSQQCGMGSGISVCPKLDQAIVSMSPLIPLPIIPLYLPFPVCNEYCKDNCLGLEFENSLDESVVFYPQKAQIIQNGRHLLPRAYEIKSEQNKHKLANQIPDQITLQPAETMIVYFSDFEPNETPGKLEDMQYCLKAFCKNIDVDHLRIKRKWVYLYWTMNGGWKRDF